MNWLVFYQQRWTLNELFQQKDKSWKEFEVDGKPPSIIGVSQKEFEVNNGAWRQTLPRLFWTNNFMINYNVYNVEGDKEVLITINLSLSLRKY